MGWLQVVDGILGLKVVKWGLLVSTIALLACTVVFKLQTVWAKADLAKAKAQVATYAAAVDIQSRAVEEWKAEGERQQKKAAAAVQESGRVRTTYEKKLIYLKSQFTQESCCGAIEDFKKAMIGGNP